MPIKCGLALAALASGIVWAQTARPEFEVASIRPSRPVTETQATAGVHIDGSQMHANLLTLKDYIGVAYRIRLPQLVAPDWIAQDRFDIAATLPAGVDGTQLPELLQTLLESRFGLKVHRDMKEFPVYVLEQAKGGALLKEIPADPLEEKPDPKAGRAVTGTGSANGVFMNLGRGASISFGSNKMEAKKVTMAMLVGTLERFMDRPVVDQSGLTGNYDVTLDLTEEDYRVMMIRAAVSSGTTLPPQALRLLDGASTSSLFGAIEKLGLKLTPRKAPLEILVVDQANKTPSEN